MRASQVVGQTLVVVGTLVGAFVVFQLRFIVILLFGAILFASTIRPWTFYLQRRGLGQTASILVLYAASLLSFVAAGIVLVPTVVGRLIDLLAAQNQILLAVQQVLSDFRLFTFLQAKVWVPVPSAIVMQQYLTNLQESFQGSVNSYVFHGFRAGTEVLLLFVMAFYWLTERDRIESLGVQLIPLNRRTQFLTIFNEIEAALGAYVRGQAIMSLSVALLSFVGLLVLGVPYAPVLAIIAGITELIPMIGPVIGMVPAVLIALLTSPQQALAVVVLYVVIQQAESHLLVPKIMSHQVGLSPLLVILALASGNALAGILGAVLAIPIAAALRVFARHLVILPTIEANQPVQVGGLVLVGEAAPAVTVATTGPVVVLPAPIAGGDALPPGAPTI